METHGQKVLKCGPKIHQIINFQVTSFVLYCKLVVMLFKGGLILLASALILGRSDWACVSLLYIYIYIYLFAVCDWEGGRGTHGLSVCLSVKFLSDQVQTLSEFCIKTSKFVGGKGGGRGRDHLVLYCSGKIPRHYRERERCYDTTERVFWCHCSLPAFATWWLMRAYSF